MKNDKEAEANTMLPFVLDDLGCNGSEKNLLDCLPQHNCVSDDDFENAGVNCSRKGAYNKSMYCYSCQIIVYTAMHRCKSGTWSEYFKEQQSSDIR